MGSISLPSALVFCKMLKNSPKLVCTPKIAHDVNRDYSSKLSYSISQELGVSYKDNGSMRMVSCGAKDSGAQEENRALETVLKLYEAIKNRNVYEISDIIAEECLCVSNFVSAFKPFLGKKQVLGFFSSLMNNLGTDIEFVVQQTLDDGMVVGVTWKLEWNRVPLPLGKGFSLYMCHVYQGKVMIKNVEIFMEPVFHIEPLRLVSLQILVRLKIISFIKEASQR
ncbi:hypothetical protein DH2020_017202 [Rehmannia glutinosa]|uniref:SnoaL-like domain-containing protein n=1 Tax=Rehmannia glutinosa TaxID=99300 RepID=A0ABR0WQE8_REHGL